MCPSKGVTHGARSEPLLTPWEAAFDGAIRVGACYRNFMDPKRLLDEALRLPLDVRAALAAGLWRALTASNLLPIETPCGHRKFSAA